MTHLVFSQAIRTKFAIKETFFNFESLQSDAGLWAGLDEASGTDQSEPSVFTGNESIFRIVIPNFK